MKMTSSKLIYSDILNESWKSLKGQLPLVAGLSLVFTVGLLVLFKIPFLGQAVMGPFSLGYLKCLLRIRSNETIGYSDFFWGFQEMNRFVHALLLSVLISLGYLGFIFLLIPGIWWMVASTFANAIFVMGTEDCIEALKKSIALVQGRWWNVAGLIGVLCLINFAGAMCFAIGIFISLPVATLALYIAAEKLLLTTPPQVEILPAEAPVTVV
jgi:hypothetical protein